MNIEVVARVRVRLCEHTDWDAVVRGRGGDCACACAGQQGAPRQHRAHADHHLRITTLHVSAHPSDDSSEIVFIQSNTGQYSLSVY
jgi:hypothetical protein